MLNYINNHWSIARRLTVIAVMGLLPSVPVLWGVTAADLANIDTARQEIDGLDLQDKVWAFMEKAETGGKADAARELQAKVAAYPHRDAIAPDVDALFAARGDVARTKVGADLFDEIASVSKLALDPEAGSYYLMDILSQRLPHLRHQLAEIDDHLRQAPADGRLEPHVATHLAIAAEMTTRIRTSANRLKAEDAAAWSRIDPQLQVLAEYERWYESRSESLAALGTNDIRAAVRSIGAAKSALWQAGKSELERMLVERVDHNWADIVTHSATVGVLALVALALALLLARAFALVLARQIDSLDRLSRDDDAVDVGSAPSTNENGAIAASLVRLKDSLRERRRLAEETKRQVVEKEQLNAHYVREHEVFMEAFREAANRLAAGDFGHRITQTVIDEYREIVEVMNSLSERLEKTQVEIEAGNVRRDEAIAAVAAALARLAEGDLRARIEDGVASEFEKLKADFNSAVQELELSIGEVKSNTGSIKLGTDEISAASDDLSRRTENQAATLEQTAAAVAEITTAVAKTSESATQANNIVAGTRADAERSGEVVSNAISAMSAIEKSSQQISQIIGVIDEIAFQTNLLALNAGVEAARAGEAGRGFAVVASEVRALAQRSAEAAKQIKGLISTSSKEVATGVELVGETGRALKRILEQVSEVSTAVAGIAASARSQAEGLSQVNTAVAQMDDVTQQNAAMVEQATAATRALLQQTEQLSSVVDRFKTGNRGMSDALHMMKGRMAAAPAPRESHAKGRPSKVAAVAVANARASAAGGWEEF